MLIDLIKVFIILLNKNSNFIFFCENNVIYEKIFYTTIVDLIKRKKILIIITLNSKINKSLKSKYFNYYNFSNINFIFILLKIIKSKIIITSTPTINKSINHYNRYIYVQHSLIRLVNFYSKKYLKYFDVVFVSNIDQFNDIKPLSLKYGIAVKKIRYHNIKFINSKNKVLKKNKTILIATSFYGNHILKLIKRSFLEKILIKYNIIFRLHSETSKNSFYLKKINKLGLFFKDKNLKFSNELSNFNDINNSDYLITDFSGIALTFSLKKKIPTIVVLKNYRDSLILRNNFSSTTIKKILIESDLDCKKISNLIKKIDYNKKYYNHSISKYSHELFKDFNNKNLLSNYLLRI